MNTPASHTVQSFSLDQEVVFYFQTQGTIFTMLVPEHFLALVNDSNEWEKKVGILQRGGDHGDKVSD